MCVCISVHMNACVKWIKMQLRMDWRVLAIAKKIKNKIIKQQQHQLLNMDGQMQVLECEVDRNYVTITVWFDHLHQDKEHILLAMQRSTSAPTHTFSRPLCNPLVETNKIKKKKLRSTNHILAEQTILSGGCKHCLIRVVHLVKCFSGWSVG